MVTRSEAEELLRTLFSDPGAARARAEEELVPDPDPAMSSIGHQVVGIVLRDLGHTDLALSRLRTGLQLAHRSGNTEREADVRATLGATLAALGRTREGLAQLDRAAEELTGLPLGRVLTRRAWVLGYLLSRHQDSASDLRRARSIFEREGDRVWENRALNLQGLAHANAGDLALAEAAFEASGVISADIGDSWGVATSVHNAGWVASLGGDLPLALARYADASARFEELGMTSVDLVIDRCDVYLAAGLASDAVEVVEQALAARPLLPREQVDLLVSVAESALAAGDWDRATSAADEASRLLRNQSRHVRRLRADLMSIAARAAAGLAPARLLPRAERLVSGSREADVPELPQALLLGARLARQVRSPRAAGLAREWLEEAATFRRAGTGITRALGWLALAQRRLLDGDPRGVLRACDRGLRALDEHRAMMGSVELSALATGHGAALAALGTQTALASGDARQLLRWSERWRATAIAVPSAVVDHDPETATDLAALRAEHSRLAEARTAGRETSRLEARMARLEQSVRQRLMHQHGARTTGPSRSLLDVGELLEALAQDDTVLVELVEVDGHLHAIVAGHGRVRRHAVGSAADAATALDFAVFALRRAARGGRSQLDVAGARLQRALLGRAAEHLPYSRVVVSGTAALQGVPWGLLPAFVDRPVTSTPSARLWMRSRAIRPEPGGRRVMLVGPGLASGGAEVPAVAAQDPDAVVLDGEAATVEASLAALDGAELAHVAAHGHFREDSPLFSSITLADGPLLVHDLQRLRRPPHRVVLSACESGVMQPVGAQELLGLSAALLSMGTAGVVSSLAEVDDHATVEVMVALHRSLREGSGLGEALLAARRATAGDPVLAATAAAFTVIGS